MRSSIVLAGLVATAAPAVADNGVYISSSFSFGAPTVTTSAGSESDALTGFRVRGAAGYRFGAWAIEPELVLQSIDRHDYAMSQSTTIYDYASVGLAAKYVVQQGPLSWYLRVGGHRSSTQASITRGPSQLGGGFDGAVGIQLGHRDGRLAAAFFIEAGYDMTWLRERDAMTGERLGTTLLSIGFGGGTGY